jgi:hypothetical protein
MQQEVFQSKGNAPLDKIRTPTSLHIGSAATKTPILQGFAPPAFWGGKRKEFPQFRRGFTTADSRRHDSRFREVAAGPTNWLQLVGPAATSNFLII